MFLEQLTIYMQKDKIGPFPHTTHKYQLKM